MIDANDQTTKKIAIWGTGKIASEFMAFYKCFLRDKEYLSWERFFTALLIERTRQNEYMQYRKANLSDFYLTDKNVEKIYGVIPEEIKDLFN